MINWLTRAGRTIANGEIQDDVIGDLIRPPKIKWATRIDPSSTGSVGALKRHELTHPYNRWNQVGTPKELTLWATVFPQN